MALEQKLSLRLAQKLVMTPSLQQAIKLLQMTKLELEGVVSQELEENPILESGDDIDDDEGAGANEDPSIDTNPDELPADPQSTADAASEGASSPESADEPVSQVEEQDTTTDESKMDDIDLDAYFNDYLDTGSEFAGGGTFELREAAPIENTLTREQDLYDQLLWQLHMIDLDPQLREVAELIVGNLDEDGFLQATVQEIQLLGAMPDEIDAYRAALEEYERVVTAHAEAAEAVALAGEGSVPDQALQEHVQAGHATGAFGRVATAGGGAFEPGYGGSWTSETEARGPVALPAIPSVPGYSERLTREALDLVRSLDPAGVGAGDLRESLLLQLERAGQEETLAYRLVACHWDQVLKRQFAAIAKELEMPLEELREPVDEIKALDTRPGRRFGGERTQYVEPDVAVVKVSGEYVIQLNDDGMPRLRVSRAYRRMLQQMKADGRNGEAQQYIKEKMRSAVWLIKSLDQRQRTIYKVADSIVRQQRAFLDQGLEHLRPMVLRDVAEDIGMHESTVSRVVSNKYIHTPRGLFPMKFFFHSGIDSASGEDISSLTVKRKIQQFIQAEDPKKPISDSGLMKLLQAEGVKIARRTVAKYRDELGIPSSTDRKQVF